MSKTKKQQKNLRIANLTDRISQSIKTHDLLEQLPEMCVPYSVRQVHGGQVTYFNFELAKEMGLLPAQHEEKITQDLEEVILNQFNIRIINEFDRIQHTQFKSEDVKPFKCFSTRYLQLQHKNKQGRTSGDGRAIWNGQVHHKGKTWDINSRGTGVTCLAPGLVEAEIPLETGNEDYGYSCGLSELPEIYATCIMSERFYKHSFSTERVLTVIDNGKGLGIVVRAHENLLRPAHLFRYLKLGDHHGAKKLLQHSIDRDYKNQKISFHSKHKNAFEKYLNVFSENFLKVCIEAYHKEVFLWLDWDGDNILVDGGIIDYGSVRRFGTHHNKYKYNDVARYSTNLDEQIKKGKLTVQVFAQLVDFVLTGEKKKLSEFAHHNAISSFEDLFEQELRKCFLRDLGLSELEIKKMMRWGKQDVENIYSQYQHLKQKKVTQELETLDGINQWPALNMNVVLSDVDKLVQKPKSLHLNKYLADYTEHSPQHENMEELKNELVSFCQNLKDFKEKYDLKLSYAGDFNKRLTTSAVIDLVGQIMEQPSKIQKQIQDCIGFGFSEGSRWIAKAKALYRDDL